MQSDLPSVFYLLKVIFVCAGADWSATEEDWARNALVLSQQGAHFPGGRINSHPCTPHFLSPVGHLVAVPPWHHAAGVSRSAQSRPQAAPGRPRRPPVLLPSRAGHAAQAHIREVPDHHPSAAS